MSRRIVLWVGIVCGGLACETSSPGIGGAGGGGAAGGAGGAPPIGAVCDVDTLAAQCPPGSLPIVDEAQTRSCERDAEITDDSGAITGVCRAREACTFICNFSDPCRCGIDRITNEGVFCAECTTACGNAICEGGENPEICPIDCAERCPPDAERCNGNDREVCEDTGLWTRLTCREDQRCIVAADPVVQALTLCETRVSQGGGVFDGMGSWYPVQVDDYSAARFSIAGLPQGTTPLIFLDDGRLLGIQDGVFVTLDLSDPQAPTVTNLPTRLPGNGAQIRRLNTGPFDVSALGYVVSQTRLAGGDLFGKVWDIESGGLRTLVDFGGYPTNYQGLVGIRRGPWAISPDASKVAFALGVPFDDALRVSIIVWNAETGQVHRVLRLSEPGSGVDPEAVPTGLHFNADGSSLVALYPNAAGSLMVIWDVAARRYARLIQSTVSNAGIAASRAGDSRVLISDGRQIEVWDLMAEARLASTRQDGQFFGFLPDGETLYVDAVQLAVEGGAAGMLPASDPLFDPIEPRIIADGLIFGAR